MAEAKRGSIETERRERLTEMNWTDVHEPGAYVELGSGDLYRVPKEALVTGASPVVVKESRGSSRLVQISETGYARTSCV